MDVATVLTLPAELAQPPPPPMLGLRPRGICYLSIWSFIPSHARSRHRLHKMLQRDPIGNISSIFAGRGPHEGVPIAREGGASPVAKLRPRIGPHMKMEMCGALLLPRDGLDG